MSSPNYGEKNLRIKIPIEIVPDEIGIDEETKKLSTRERIEKGRVEGRRRIYDEEHIDDAYPRRSQLVLKGNGGMAEYVERKKLIGLVAGVTATKFRLGHTQASLAGTASVPVGGKAPEDIKPQKVMKKVKNPDAGLHVYGEDDPPGTIEKIISKTLGGPQKAQQALGMLKNPIALAKFLGPVALPIIGGFILIELIKRFSLELVRKGSILDKTFKNLVHTRFEVLRTREQQQRILVGFGPTAQLITTTVAGTTNPRDAYNTYTIFNEDQMELEEKFAIRNDKGYD